VTSEDPASALLAVIAEAAASAGCLVEGVRQVSAGTLLVLDVTVDLAEEPSGSGQDGVPPAQISLAEVAAASRAISAALDRADLMGERPYTLQVGSPGAEAPLTLPRHWRRAIGRPVEVELSDGGRCAGEVIAVEAGGIVLGAPDDAVAAESRSALPNVRLDFDRIRCGRITLVFDR